MNGCGFHQLGAAHHCTGVLVDGQEVQCAACCSSHSVFESEVTSLESQTTVLWKRAVARAGESCELDRVSLFCCWRFVSVELGVNAEVPILCPAQST